MTALLKPCLDCGDLSENTRCPEHDTRPAEIKRSSTSRGYGTTWRKLSERARRLQPWCLDCGATDDLTADHSPEAWRRHEAGLQIRLQDVEVVCRGCNTRRGKARGGGVDRRDARPLGKAQSQSHTPGGIQ